GDGHQELDERECGTDAPEGHGMILGSSPIPLNLFLVGFTAHRSAPPSCLPKAPSVKDLGNPGWRPAPRIPQVGRELVHPLPVLRGPGPGWHARPGAWGCAAGWVGARP